MSELHTFEGWRARARSLLAQGVPPQEASWESAGQRSLLFIDTPPITSQSSPVPKAFLALAKRVCLHRDDRSLSLLYRILWRLTHGERTLLGNPADEDVLAANRVAKAISRDVHKMHAFVRFRSVQSEHGESFVAFHRPDHFILRAAVPFFVKRFGSMRWRIETPDESADWDTHLLTFSAGVVRPSVEDDPVEAEWQTYYKAIANPARLKLRMMKKEMPVRHWQTMPETAVIRELLQQAAPRVEQMRQMSPQAATPAAQSLLELRSEAARCNACPLHRCATQTVFGVGPDRAEIMLVGEQPGNEEDLVGAPFVGPAGQLLDRALLEAGIDRSTLYVTNAVKHFKFEERGKVRLHKKADGREIVACKPWLLAELAFVKPRAIVCLGVTAASSLLGRSVTIARDSEDSHAMPNGAELFVTYHPAAILRAPAASQSKLFSAMTGALKRAQLSVAAPEPQALRAAGF